MFCNIYHLPLPKKGYFFHCDAVSNILSMVIVSDSHCLVMDTDTDNDIYVFNDDGTYIQFLHTKWNVYELQVEDASNTEQCNFITVKGMGIQFLDLD